MQMDNGIDVGKASAIALAYKTNKYLLIIDDFKGRKVAKVLRINYTGSIGVLLKAKETGLISSVRNILQRIVKETNFRLDDAVVQLVLELAGES